MIGLKVPLAEAEKAKQFLLKRRLFDTTKLLRKDDYHLIFPLKAKAPFPAGWQVMTTEFLSAKPEGTLKELLDKDLTDKEKAAFRDAYDVIGNVAILEILPELEKKEKLIAMTLLRTRPAITTVLKKSGMHTGEFRTQKLHWIAGKRTKVATYKESGCTLTIDVEKVYFSVRLAHERLRIVKLVKPGEKILVLFSGCAPYPVVLSKHTRAKEILGIEINPLGHNYGLKNVTQNDVKNVKLICGDAAKELPKLAKKKVTFDRIIMPLPKSADEFLKKTLLVAKKGTVIHFYAFAKEEEFADKGRELVKQCAAFGKKCELLATVHCGQHAPRVFRVCFDLHVL